MKNMTKKLVAFFVSVLFLAGFFGGHTAYASDMPYTTYSYNYWNEGVVQPHAYIYSESLKMPESESQFRYPQDMFVTDDCLVICDTNNSRIVIMNFDGTVTNIITHAKNSDDLLSNPQGVFVGEDGHMYVCDTGNGRLVEYDENCLFVREIGRPVTELISEEQVYSPTKAVVDTAGRIYVIAYGINMGLIEFGKDGNFVGFHGAAEVTVSRLTYIWKNYFSTDAQKERMETIVPTEYSNIFLDSRDFIYTTISNLDEEAHLAAADAVRYLNPTGTDILRRLGNIPITGDLYASSDNAEWSMFTDICATDYGCYFVLDSAGGKVFVYDYDGNSLFIFGDKGNRKGTFKTPSAIGINKDATKLYVLDSQLSEILVFDITDYGSHFLAAMEKNSSGDSDGAYTEWTYVLKANSNAEAAYIGIGKAYLKTSEYKKAMEYFELGNSRKYYSTAFYYYRKELMQQYFPIFMTCLGAAILVIFVIYVVRKLKRLAGEIRCTMDKH